MLRAGGVVEARRGGRSLPTAWAIVGVGQTPEVTLRVVRDVDEAVALPALSRDRRLADHEEREA